MTLEEKLEQELDEGVIADSELSKFSRCGYYYFLGKHVGFGKAPKSAYAHMALFFEIQRKKLFDIHDRDIGLLFSNQKLVGNNTLPPQNMDAATLMQHLAFLSPESFGEAMGNRWLLATQEGEYAGTPINWDSLSQAGSSSRILKLACSNYYRFVLKHGAPLTGFQNTKLLMEFNDLRFAVKIPEVRSKDGQLYIDDPAIWGFNADWPGDETEFLRQARKSNINTSGLVTLKIMTLDHYVRNYEFFRLKLGLREVPNSLDYITFRHYDASKDLITETKRVHDDTIKLGDLLEQFKIKREIFEPDHRYCPACPFNTILLSGEIACRQRAPDIKPSVPKAYLFKKNMTYDITTDPSSIRFNGFILDGPRKIRVLQMVIKLESQSNIVAYSHYTSHIRGHKYEMWSMQEAIKQLKTLKKQNKKSVTHIINVERDYPHTGKIKIREFLAKKKYEVKDNLYQKTY